ncbi:hypothetical protein N7493_004014 [Penicillium malachiteum]|uniref:CCHC-type domain-containing protein n=1 Tax=Penicillium malachiteum TaxID=1324776 RepID=A0AAD6HRR8_9EURO|nr:hypothetical protein N7493_004014 [Penicillium malachiteum]
MTSEVSPWRTDADASAGTPWGAHDENLNPQGSDDNTCRNCGATDHFARNCPNEPSQQFSGACFNCGQEGHNKADCPEPRKLGGACFNCGQEGHSKADCPEPRKFTGACFNCGEEGHSKSDCPNPREFKGTCRLCERKRATRPLFALRSLLTSAATARVKVSHLAKDCTANRKFDLGDIPDKLPEEAWAMMKAASDERDLGEFRDALKVYSKSKPLATYVDIEKKMREEKFNIYLIAMEKDPVDVMSLIDLQGVLDREFVVGFFYNATPQRRNLRSRWPSNADENLERLANAGLPYDRQIMKCRNCGEMGHGSRTCKAERVEIEQVEIKCANCSEIGHRVRDCPQPRRSKHGCRNCGSEDHMSKECPEPRSADDVECRRCNETGHFAKDCPNAGDGGGPRTCRNCGSEDHLARDCDQPRNESTMTCRNCDQTGHMARDCPEPKNWSKVKCNRCGEMGHTVRRCPQPEPEGEGSGENGDYGHDSSLNDPWNTQDRTGGDQGEWQSSDQFAKQDDNNVEETSERFESQAW